MGGALVVERNFLLATRDTGYRTSAAAVAELIDNALQAGASRIHVLVIASDQDDQNPSIAVLDNGCGMDTNLLRGALQFGGTSRFNDRSGPGRYGMGLPNSSVSHARRVEVYSWRSPERVLYSYLDIDEVEAGDLRGVPAPRPRPLPAWGQQLATSSGTLVIWSRCDRLQGRRLSTVVRQLARPFGQMFRYFLWGGVKITVNGEPVRPVDPLFLHPNSPYAGAAPFGKTISYTVRVPADPKRVARIRVRFSELPVEAWHDLPAEEKRRAGVVKGAGVSVVRARREVAYGWFCMGRKRKENYDDWWRCEVSFEPDLDEYFGLTHSKQGITPTPNLEAVLSPDMEAIAHTLNARVRSAFARLKAASPSSAARLASRRESRLPPVARYVEDGTRRGRADVPRRVRTAMGLRYRLVVESLRDEAFYACSLAGDDLILTLNRDHPFFDKVYRPATEQGSISFRTGIESLLFALARAEVDAPGRVQRYWYRRKRLKWSNALAAFLGS